MNFTFWITEDCNLRCKYCYVKKNPKYMSRRTAEKAVSFLKEKIKSEMVSKVNINFHGGEPFLNFDVIKYICEELQCFSKINSIQITYSLTTNGTCFNEEIINYIVANNIRVSVSMDGDKETHDKNRVFRDGAGSFGHALKFLLELKNRQHHVRVRMTVTKHSVNNLFDNYRYFYDMGFKGVVAIPDTTITPWDESSIKSFEIQLNEIVAYLKNNNMKDYYYFILNVRNCKFRKLNVCDGGRQSFQIAADGELYPCAMVVGNSKFIIGDVSLGVNEKKLVEFDEIISVRNDSCKGCSLNDFCEGERCKYINFKSTNNFNEPSAAFCRIHQIEYKMLKNNIQVLDYEK